MKIEHGIYAENRPAGRSEGVTKVARPVVGREAPSIKDPGVNANENVNNKLTYRRNKLSEIACRQLLKRPIYPGYGGYMPEKALFLR
jgi:hypothetical protein